VLTTAKPVATKPLTMTQRAVQATTHLKDLISRDDVKVLSVALAEAAIAEVQRNPAFKQSIQGIYDALVSNKPAKRAGSKATPKQLIPITSAGEVAIGREDAPDAYVLQKLYGNVQLRDALERYTLSILREMAEKVMKNNPGTKPKSKSKRDDVIDYIVSQLTAK
jgi:hypothetical protein